MKNQRRSETRMTLSEYFGEEADKQIKDTVRITLIKIAEQIESMEVSE